VASRRRPLRRLPRPVLAALNSAVRPAEDDLFFVEEPALAAGRRGRAARPRPACAAATAAAPAPAKPSPARAAAPARLRPRPRPARRPGPTPPPSMAPDRRDPAAAAQRAFRAPRRARARRGPGRAPSSPPIALIAGGAVLRRRRGRRRLLPARASTPAIASITPARVGLGQSVTIAGTHFGATAGRERRPLRAASPGASSRPRRPASEVEIPEMRRRSGRDTPVPVVVVVDGHESKAARSRVFEAPRIHGISPAVAMPGDEVVLAGAGWARASAVQFGSTAATVLDTTPRR
jgi:hypothetical protein